MPFKGLKIKEPIPNEETLAQYLVREDSLLIYLDVLSLRPTSPRLFFCR